MDGINIQIDYFAPAEFVKCTPSCLKSDMDPQFMKRLNRARRYAGVPFVLNSAYRNVEYEKNKGRTGNSMHTKGRAVDIRCVDSVSRHQIVQALLAVGFHGIGIGNTFIHVDDRENKLIWLY